MSAPSLPRDNPFRPTFGAAPLYWVGREVILRSFERALVGTAGTPGRSLVISGSRGIGKTVLLNELEDRARTQGWIVLRASGRSPIVDDFVETTIPAAIEGISPRPTTRVKQVGLGKVASIGFDTDDQAPYKHNLNTRLRELSGHLTGTGVLISIDEAQDASLEDLTTIAVAYQDLIRDDLDVALVVAGLPQGIDKLLSLPGATFLRRAEKYLLGPLNQSLTAEAFELTARDSGISFSPDGIQAAAELSHGYPYLVQLVGSLSWQQASLRAGGEDGAAITEADVAEIAPQAISLMGTQVHQPAVKELSPALREFLEAMAQAAPADPVPVHDIAAALGRTLRSLSGTRQRLIDADIIESPRYGELNFTLPYLREYLLARDSGGRVS